MRYFYVICPVGSDPSFTEKKSALKELGAAYDIIPFFPLEQHDQFSIELAIKDMRDAEFVLADLSLERPSCYFELGIAQAEGVEVFLVAAVGTPIHQVGGPRKNRFYSGLTGYRLEVSSILRSALNRRVATTEQQSGAVQYRHPTR